MKTVFIIRFAILLTGLISSTVAFADVKIKARQTVSGQTIESTTYIKGKRQRTEQNTGAGQMISITQCDLKQSVQLNPNTQMYILQAWEQDTNSPGTTTNNGNTTTVVKKGGVITTTITIKDTGETRKMFGYNARHLIITTETESSADACSFQPKSKMVTDGWYIDAAFALDCNYDYRNYGTNTNSGGCRDKYNIKQIGTAKRGYPVIEKMTMFDENGKETFTMQSEVIELANATLDASLFEIPNGWREAKNPTEMYSSTSSSSSQNSKSSQNQNSSLNSTVSNMNSNNSPSNSTTVEAKKEGVIRIGLAGVKTGVVGDGMNAAELASAIQNSLPVYLKGTKVEIVGLEAKLQSAIEAEAKEKECDYVLFATISHKKGGGGFGFGKVLGSVVSQTGMTSTGNATANVVGSVAAQSVANAASNVKSKDELTLEIKLQNGLALALNKQFKQKAKSNGEDIISPIVEQAAQAIVTAVSK